jgi:hypothetical protein
VSCWPLEERYWAFVAQELAHSRWAPLIFVLRASPIAMLKSGVVVLFSSNCCFLT